MKRILIASLSALFISLSAFATDESKVNINIRESFKEEYKVPGKVEWTIKQDFIKASFDENGARVNVFYDPQGVKMGTSHTIVLEDLPLSARRTIAKRYADYTITEAVEFVGASGTAFYISAEDSKEKLILKITDDSSVTTFKKSRKDKFFE